MSKKMRVVLAVIAAVLVLTVGTAAVALAQEDSPQPAPGQGTCGFWGVNIDQRLELAVEKGIITQAEADEIEAWIAERPAALDKLQGFFFNNANQLRKAYGEQFRMHRGDGPGMMGGGWRWQKQISPNQPQ